MTSGKLEIDAFQLAQKCLPSKLRALGIVCLMTPFVDGWEGPNPDGFTQCGASSIHTGQDMHSEGWTLWFFFPPGSMGSQVDPHILADAPSFILPRAFRRSHVPVNVFHCIIVRTFKPTGSN